MLELTKSQVQEMAAKAEEGDYTSAFTLSRYYMGLNDNVNWIESVKWARKAYEIDQKAVMMLVSSLIHRAFEGDLKEALGLLEKHAATNRRARMTLGLMHIEGSGTERDVAKGMEIVGPILRGRQDLISKVASEVKRSDPNRSVDVLFGLYTRLARVKDETGTVQLSRMYHDGRSTAKDLDKAISLLEGIEGGTSHIEYLDYLMERGDMDRAMGIMESSDDPQVKSRYARIVYDGGDKARGLELMRESAEAQAGWLTDYMNQVKGSRRRRNGSTTYTPRSPTTRRTTSGWPSSAK